MHPLRCCARLCSDSASPEAKVTFHPMEHGKGCPVAAALKAKKVF